MTPRPPGRAVMVLAAGLLFLDGLLLVLGGLWMRRPGLLVLGVVLLAGGFVMIWLWRRWRGALAGIAEAQRQLKQERDAIRTLLDRSRPRR